MTLSIVRAMAYHASQWRSNFQVTKQELCGYVTIFDFSGDLIGLSKDFYRINQLCN